MPARVVRELQGPELAMLPASAKGYVRKIRLGHALPGRLKRRDPLAEHVPAVLAALVDHLEQTRVVVHAFEVQRALEATVGGFLETVRTGCNVHHDGEKQEAFEHRAPRLGRNAPCFCGSGKKFKKCHGRPGLRRGSGGARKVLGG